MVRNAIYNGVANKLDTLIEQLSKEIEDSKFQADKIFGKDQSAFLKENNTAASPQKSD